jgi:hypothetical protein
VEVEMGALDHPKHEIFAIERASGVSGETAWEISGEAMTMTALTGEIGGKRRSRVARQALFRIETRIELLSEITKGLQGDAMLRNMRAVAELRWCQELIRNGGTEPWAWLESSQAQDADDADSG